MRYEAPETLDRAVALLASEGNARILAGGTDLLVQMRTDVIDPAVVIDIKRIGETRRIEETAGGGFRIGAAVTGSELREHPRLPKIWPGVVEAANLIGSTQVQGRATLGGNLCNASPAADSVPALVAAGAKAIIAGPSGRREVPVEDVAIGVRKLSLSKGELIVAFDLPARGNPADAYLRFIPRTEMDIAVVGCGISLAIDSGGVCSAARVALGAVAERVLLVPDAGKALVGTKLDASALDKAAAAASAACRPIDDKRGTKDFRIKVAGVLTRRVAEIAYQRAQGLATKGQH